MTKHYIFPENPQIKTLKDFTQKSDYTLLSMYAYLLVVCSMVTDTHTPTTVTFTVHACQGLPKAPEEPLGLGTCGNIGNLRKSKEP